VRGGGFSGGLIYGMPHGWPIHDSFDLACASSPPRCDREGNRPMQALTEVRSAIRSFERAEAPAG
jgi:hypothetical protein